jgi:hypothetical protein
MKVKRITIWMKDIRLVSIRPNFLSGQPVIGPIEIDELGVRIGKMFISIPSRTNHYDVDSEGQNGTM